MEQMEQIPPSKNTEHTFIIWQTNKQAKWDLFISIQFKLDGRQVFDLTLNSFFYCFSAEPVWKNIDEGIFQPFPPLIWRDLFPPLSQVSFAASNFPRY